MRTSWRLGPGAEAGRGSADVWAEVTGCATISNGYIYAGGELP
jgi:hypothetical protein